jgi:hypothetical protein
MADKLQRNYHAHRKGTKDSETIRGHVHNDNVLSAYMVRSGYDYRHYVTLDADKGRQGWTIIRCPGAFELKAGDDVPYNKFGIYLEAINGDIVLRAKNGRIKLDAENIDLFAEGTKNNAGVINLESNEQINLTTKNLTINVDSVAKFFSSGSLQLVADASLDIYGGLVDVATSAQKIKASKFPSRISKIHNKKNFV